MRISLLVVFVASFGLLGRGAEAAIAGNESPGSMVTRCLDTVDRAKEREICITQLRALGPKGLELLSAAATDRIDDANVRTLMDGVAQQRDGWASQLYWYRDHDEAVAAGRATNRPVISLRLLGDLTEIYSCANSRFFRTLLYADPEIAALMRDNFILHWSSERPAPVVTVDFGDGRVLKKTITGNSIHYIIGADGHVYDAMPGLVTPQTFKRWLTNAAHHRTRTEARQIKREWSRALATAGVAPERRARVRTPNQGPRINAAVAMPRAASKAVVEAPILRRMDQIDVEQLAALSSDDTYRKIAANTPWFDVSAPTRALMKRDSGLTGWPYLKMETNFIDSVKIDDVRNRFGMRHAVMKMIEDGETDFDALNRRVYVEVMKTPRDDPWLGMHDDASFSGLPKNGLAR